jgi:hypothetical protein
MADCEWQEEKAEWLYFRTFLSVNLSFAWKEIVNLYYFPNSREPDENSSCIGWINL